MSKELFARVSPRVAGFQMTVEKPQPKELLRPITTGANSAMNQSEFLASCNLQLAQKRGKKGDWFWFCLSSVEELA